MTDKRVEAAARAICRSGRFETGQGTCAVLCMSQLGDARKRPCEYATRLHGKMAQAALSAADAAVADEARALYEHGRFLLDRLADLDIPEELARDWMGHVEPAIERFRAALIERLVGLEGQS